MCASALRGPCVSFAWSRCPVAKPVARRSRLLFLDARLSAQVAQATGDIVRQETGRDPQTTEFIQLAAHYLQMPT